MLSYRDRTVLKINLYYRQSRSYSQSEYVLQKGSTEYKRLRLFVQPFQPCFCCGSAPKAHDHNKTKVKSTPMPCSEPSNNKAKDNTQRLKPPAREAYARSMLKRYNIKTRMIPFCLTKDESTPTMPNQLTTSAESRLQRQKAMPRTKAEIKDWVRRFQRSQAQAPQAEYRKAHPLHANKKPKTWNPPPQQWDGPSDKQQSPPTDTGDTITQEQFPTLQQPPSALARSVDAPSQLHAASQLQLTTVTPSASSSAGGTEFATQTLNTVITSSAQSGLTRSDAPKKSKHRGKSTHAWSSYPSANGRQRERSFSSAKRKKTTIAHAKGPPKTNQQALPLPTSQQARKIAPPSPKASKQESASGARPMPVIPSTAYKAPSTKSGKPSPTKDKLPAANAAPPPPPCPPPSHSQAGWQQVRTHKRKKHSKTHKTARNSSKSTSTRSKKRKQRNHRSAKNAPFSELTNPATDDTTFPPQPVTEHHPDTQTEQPSTSGNTGHRKNSRGSHGRRNSKDAKRHRRHKRKRRRSKSSDRDDAAAFLSNADLHSITMEHKHAAEQVSQLQQPVHDHDDSDFSSDEDSGSVPNGYESAPP